MKRNYPVKKKLSFRENIQIIIPLIYDDFMSYKDRIVNHPRLKHELRPFQPWLAPVVTWISGAQRM